MNSSELSRIKSQIDDILDPTLSKHDWAKALCVSTASFHRYLDEKEGGNVPDDVARLMGALLAFLKIADVDTAAIREALKATGVAGVVARAASAGLLPATTVSLLASTPALIWLGAIGGAVGAVVGAGALAFFQKIKPAPDASQTRDKK